MLDKQLNQYYAETNPKVDAMGFVCDICQKHKSENPHVITKSTLICGDCTSNGLKWACVQAEIERAEMGGLPPLDVMLKELEERLALYNEGLSTRQKIIKDKENSTITDADFLAGGERGLPHLIKRVKCMGKEQWERLRREEFRRRKRDSRYR